jgi:hypothetical protein
VVQIGAGSSSIHFYDNRVGDRPLAAADVDANGSEVAITENRDAMAIGPAALELDGAAHLNIERLADWSDSAKKLQERP